MKLEMSFETLSPQLSNYLLAINCPALPSAVFLGRETPPLGRHWHPASPANINVTSTAATSFRNISSS